MKDARVELNTISAAIDACARGDEEQDGGQRESVV